MMPTTSFCDRGALTMGSKIGGSAMSALVPAGDFEGHQRGWPAQVPASHDQVDVPEQPAKVESRQPDLESLEPGAPSAGALGCEVDPDHWDLSPGRRSARPTATARDGPAAWTSSAYPGSTSMRWNGLVSSTGMPQFDDR